ncbi:MAG: branched-chain amino acid ABC transporter permease [Bacillota bacterium]
MREYLLGVLAVTGITILPVLGVALLTGFTGYFTFGHGGFMAIGAYTSAILLKLYGVPLWLSIPAGGLVAALSSYLIGYPTLRLKGDYFCIATLGFGEAVRLAIENLGITGGARGLPGVYMIKNAWIPITIIAVVAVVLFKNLLLSRFGRAFTALREDEMASRAIGIDTVHAKLLALAISAGLAGLGGALTAHFVGFLHPSMFGMTKSTDLTVAVIFGGVGSLTGSVIATLLLVPLPELLRAAAEWRMAFYGLAVILIMLLRPQGLFGYRELTWESLKGLGARRPRPMGRGMA